MKKKGQRISMKNAVGLQDKIVRLAKRPEGVQIDEVRAAGLRDYQIRQQIRNLKAEGRIERRGSFKWGAYHYVYLGERGVPVPDSARRRTQRADQHDAPPAPAGETSAENTGADETQADVEPIGSSG